MDNNIIKLKNKKGAVLTITPYGGSIVSLEIPDGNHKLVNVVVGLEEVDKYKEIAYHASSKFLGASIGRYAGRISGRDISVDGIQYSIYNEDEVHLHGGKQGFDKKYWNIDTVDFSKASTILSYQSKHLEEGYPGNLEVKVQYQLTDNNELKINYSAVTDSETIINLTNHAYFNLNGKGSILNHELFLNCSNYLQVNQKKIPTGVLKTTAGNYHDFAIPRKLSFILDFMGFDDTFVYNKTNNGSKELKGWLQSKETGLRMNIYSNQPAVVIYTPDRFPKEWTFKNKAVYTDYPAITFENQKFPDALKHNHFSDVVLKPGETYQNHSTFAFINIEK